MKPACALMALALVAACATAQTTVTLATAGPAPDAVASYVGTNWVGAITAEGLFSLQGTAAASESTAGVILSHQCNSDGSFDSVWSVIDYSATGTEVSSLPYCEHAIVNGTTYVSYYDQTTACPLTAPYTGYANRNLTQTAGSDLGALTATAYCNSAFNTSLLHASALTPIFAPAPGPSMAPSAAPSATPAVSAAGRKLL